MSFIRTALIAAFAFCAAPLSAGPIEDGLHSAFDAGALPGLHAVLVQRGDDTLVEAYFKGTDERWGQPLGSRGFDTNALHDLRSVTKSVVGLLYGIALDRGQVPGPDTALMEAFPDYADLNTPETSEITIADVLTMRMGLAWDESLPYSDPRNSEIAMERAEDRIRFILSRPVQAEPGTQWTYSGGATALLAELITRGTGQPLEKFAQSALFAPLDITGFDWVEGLNGAASAASGLRLTARDLAKIGALVANGGAHNGQQLISPDWLRQSLTPRANTGSLRYGYHWWLAPGDAAPDWVAGFGNGGQRVTIGRQTGTVVVIFAGNYNQPDAWKMPIKVMTDHILPGLHR